MNPHSILDLWRGALVTTAAVAAPFLLSALAVGLTMSLLQAATQLQENVLSFVPKLLAVGGVLLLAGPWVLERLTRFSALSMEFVYEIGRNGGGL